MALRQRLAVGAVQQRQVRVERARSAPSAPQHEQLAGRVREVVVPAHDVGDAHLGVVDGDGEVVERRAVRARDHEVVEQRGSRSATRRGSRPRTTVSPSSGTRSRTAAPGRALRRPARRGSRAPPARLLGPLHVLRAGRVPVGGARARAAGRGAPHSARSARSGGTAPRPSRGRATRARPGSGRSPRRWSARGRCPRAAARARSRATCAPAASCRVPSSRRRCAGSRSGWART